MSILSTKGSTIAVLTLQLLRDVCCTGKCSVPLLGNGLGISGIIEVLSAMLERMDILVCSSVYKTVSFLFIKYLILLYVFTLDKLGIPLVFTIMLFSFLKPHYPSEGFMSSLS